MFDLVMEDGRYKRLPRRGATAAGPTHLCVVAIGALALAVGGSALAQQGERGIDFRASVLDMSEEVQSITVPLYGSVTVESTVEITRADVIAKQIVDVQVLSPTRLLITGQAYGTTSVILLHADDKQSIFEVSVELDLGRLNETIRNVDPQSDARAGSVLGNIVLTGRVSGAEQATRIVELAKLFLPPQVSGRQAVTVQNHLTVAGEQQVLLRCVVAEVARAASRELGVNGFLAGENFRDGFIVNQIGGINPINMGAAADALVTRNIPFLTDENGIPIGLATTLSLGFPRVQMQLFIRAMANNSLLRILAEPNLVAISGETATFLAGGEFPIPVPQGNQQVTIQFREFGVRLNFTPVVIGHQRIRLRVAPEVSEPDFSVAVQIEGFVVPGLTSRATETTVEMGNGQTIAIAGLLSEQIRGVASRIPGIGDVPILGALFRSVNYQRSVTELVILVTPEIVAPLDAHQAVRLPGHDMTDPSDFELYMLGLLESDDGPTTASHSQGAEDDLFGPVSGLESEPEELSVHGPWGYAEATDMR
ncbi:MAG: type II and III secretion system protein family protein [Phycisphaerales bacterium]|nr:MAG: type II and III secretion system protein family protein [Phycisphaerales bacterium]